MSKIKGLIYARRNFVNVNCRKKLFFALIYPCLLYGIEIYSLTCKYIIEPLIIACNRSLRICQNVNLYYHTKQLYNNYNILPVDLLGKLRISKCIYKILRMKDSVSKSTSSLFSLNNANHNYSTRTSNSYYLYKEANKSFYNSYVNKCCSIWNDIPLNIRNTNSLNIFLFKLSIHLYDKL